MATYEQQKRLDKLNATTDWQKTNLKRRWGVETTADRYLLNLAKVRHITRDTGHHTPKAIRDLLDKFRRLYPEYRAVGQAEWVGKLLITLYAFYAKGIAPGPIMHMLLYLCWDDTDVWGKFMDKPKKKQEMYDTFTKLGLPQLLIQESYKLLKGDKAHYIKNEYDRGWSKEVVEDIVNEAIPIPKVLAIMNLQSKILQAQEVQKIQEAKELATEEWRYIMDMNTLASPPTATYYRTKRLSKLREDITMEEYMAKRRLY